MAQHSALHKLSDYVGIEPDYWDIDGNHHETSDDTRRKFLAAMGYPAETEHAAIQTLHTLQDEHWQRVLPPATVCRLPALTVQLHLPEDATAFALNWGIELEGQDELSGTIPADAFQRTETRFVNDTQHVAILVSLPGTLPLGYHRLRISVGPCEAQGQLIVTPAQAYLPTELVEDQKRIWGIACQVYALRREHDLGIGDFTALRQLCTNVAQNDGDVVGLSPLHALFVNDPSRVSPYAPSSRLFINMALIDLERVLGFADCSKAQEHLAQPDLIKRMETAQAAEHVDYRTVVQAKHDVLKILFDDFHSKHLGANDTPERQAFETFVQEGGEELLGFGAFEALQTKFSGLSPCQWPAEFQTIHAPGSQAYIEQHQRELQFYHFVQWQADVQLLEIAATCREDGMLIGLYRDLAVGAVSDGADVWMSPELFVRHVNVGAPPDALCATGQDWGIPPLHPVKLKEATYRPFIDMLRANMRHAGAIRIDHAMWLQHVFWIPNGETGQNGAYISYPMDDLFQILALESHRNRCIVIGEDLGTVPEGFRERMAQENVLSYRLMMFERYPDGLFKRPDTYPTLALATPASHDLPPISGYWTERDIDTAYELNLIGDEESLATARNARQRDRELLVSALRDQGLLPSDFPTTVELSAEQTKTLIAAVHGFMGRTPSVLCMVNIEDVLSLQTRINLPGTVDEYPNWRSRMPFSVEGIANRGFIAACAKGLNSER